MYVKNKETGEYAGELNEIFLSINPHLEALEEGEAVYLSKDNERIIRVSPKSSDLLLSERPSDLHENSHGVWVFVDPVPVGYAFTDADDIEIRYDVTDTDFLRLMQAREALSFGAKKVKINFSTGYMGVLDADKLAELYKEAYAHKATDYVVE